MSAKALTGPELARRVTTVMERVDAYADAVRSMGGMSCGALTGLNCVEVGLLADMFVAAGRADAARVALTEHAEDDDAGDAHYALRIAYERASTYKEVAALADWYLGLCGGVRRPGWTSMLVAEESDDYVCDLVYASETDAMTALRTMLPPDLLCIAPCDDADLPGFVREHGWTVTVDVMPTVVTATVEQMALPPAGGAPITGEIDNPE